MISNFLRTLLLGITLAIGAPLHAQEVSDSDLVWDIYPFYQERDLLDLGEDAIRFSSRPALGGEGYVVELTQPADDLSIGRIYLLMGDSRSGWGIKGTLVFEIHDQDYARMARAVDAAIAESGGFFAGGPYIGGEGEQLVLVCNRWTRLSAGTPACRADRTTGRLLWRSSKLGPLAYV